MDKQLKNEQVKNKPIQVTLEDERRMRVIANLIIDRIYEDKRNKKLKLSLSSFKKNDKNKV